MEMHTRDSLRRIHGIEARPVTPRRATHLLTYSECHRLAGKARNEAFARFLSASGRRVAVFARRHVIRPVKCWLRRREAIRQLLAMTDAGLKDIGITRNDIARSVRYGRSAGN